MKLLLLMSLLLTCFSCTFTGESTGSVEFVNLETMTDVENEVKSMTSSESVQFFDIITDRDEKIIKRNLRIDLIRPKKFPSDSVAKQIINKAKANAKYSTHYTHFTLNEIQKTGNSTPAENINKTISFHLNEL